MFAYCRNTPVSRVDISGTVDTYSKDQDGKILSPEELESRNKDGGAKNTQKAFSTFSKLKKFLGSAGSGKHWHHVVEQSQMKYSGFTAEQIHTPTNVIAIDAGIHARITGYYNTTTFSFTNGLSVRAWLAGQPFQVQYDFGLRVIDKFGGK